MRSLIAELQRGKPERNERRAILIATEDEKSARTYFERVRDALRSHRVVVLADHIGSDPNSVVEAARQARDARREEHRRGLADPFDEVWVVFDTEGPQNAQRRKAALAAIDRARQSNIRTAVSNPCFEFWILLHFEWCVQVFLNGDAVCRKLRQDHLPGHSKSRDVFSDTWDRVEVATQRAEQIFRERCQGEYSHPCECHPCTEIYLLIKSLLSNS